MHTRAERVPGGYLLRGEKCMTGNGTVASIFAVLADARKGDTRLGPTIFAVPRGPLVHVSENTDKLGFRCLPTPSVTFNDVFVAEENVIGEVGGAVPVLLDSLDYMRFGGGIVILGLVDGALSEIIPWLESRHVYGGERLLDTSHVQITLGRLIAQRHALDTLLYAVADKLEHQLPCSERAATLKLLTAELAVETTAATMQLHGWRGIDAREGTQKRFRDARQTTIYEGTSEIQAMNLFRSYVRSQRLEQEP
jgi:alkylation response protein AidB-like acyl-CoA dehydrogenase